MLAYLAGPLDGVTYEEGRDWYEEIERMAPPGWVMYKPGHAFGSPASDPHSMNMANRLVIAQVATIVIANLSGPGRGFGTIREIEYAKANGTPVYVIGGDLDESLLAYDVDCLDTVFDVWPLITERIDQLMESQRSHPLYKLFHGEPPE